ncbi:3'-5' exoribonuclease YhaM [Paraconexibacter sp. AEG42_29]|uniref:3'-5' exoribonuclease YhaM n=1 Tax=Paraconexibacter sp. AEG42_29 TaxID=2997339 RepID=A0AAU7B1V6_9ACTN
MSTAVPELPTSPRLSEWQTPCDVDAVLLVREVERREKRDGSAFLRLLLGDRSGTIPAVMWDPGAAVEGLRAGTPAQVGGRCSEHPRYGRQLTVATVDSVAGDDVDWSLLLDAPARCVRELSDALDALLASIAQPHLAALMVRLLGPGTPTGRCFRLAPAAKFNHHAYRHGLLEHALDVAHGVDRLCAVFGADRDLAVCGALLHDIGKLEAYRQEGGAIDLTDAGKLLGEIPLGYYRVRQAIEQDPDFPGEIAQRLLHIVLSHHGRLEYGSPVVPSTREATLVHTVDNLSGQMGAYDRLAKQAGDERWSRFERVLGAAAFVPRPV